MNILCVMECHHTSPCL